jgi:hypothetical protein
VGRQVEQPPALEARLEDEIEVAVLEVAQPAVHESRRTARGAAREVVALDQRDRETAQGGVASDADPRDAATDHEDIESARGEGFDGAAALDERVGAGDDRVRHGLILG